MTDNARTDMCETVALNTLVFQFDKVRCIALMRRESSRLTDTHVEVWMLLRPRKANPVRHFSTKFPKPVFFLPRGPQFATRGMPRLMTHVLTAFNIQ